MPFYFKMVLDKINIDFESKNYLPEEKETYRYISKTTLTGEAIYDFDFLQYSRAFFVDIRTEQRGDPQYGRIFQDRRHETVGKSGMCKCKE